MSKQSNACCLSFFSQRSASNVSTNTNKVTPMIESQVSATDRKQIQIITECQVFTRLPHDSLKDRLSGVNEKQQYRAPHNDRQQISNRQHHHSMKQKIMTSTQNPTILEEKMNLTGRKRNFGKKPQYETQLELSTNQQSLKLVRNSNDIKNSEGGSTKYGNSTNSTGSKSKISNVFNHNSLLGSNRDNSISSTEEVNQNNKRVKVISKSKFYNNHNDDFKKETLDLVEQILNQKQSVDVEKLKNILEKQFVKHYANQDEQSDEEDFDDNLSIEEEEKDEISSKDINFSTMINCQNNKPKLQQIRKISRSQVLNMNNLENNLQGLNHLNSQKSLNYELKHQDSADFCRMGSPVIQQRKYKSSKARKAEQSQSTQKQEQKNLNQLNQKINQIQSEANQKYLNNSKDLYEDNVKAGYYTKFRLIGTPESQSKMPYLSKVQISSNPTNDMTLNLNVFERGNSLGSELILCDSISSVNSDDLL